MENATEQIVTTQGELTELSVADHQPLMPAAPTKEEIEQQMARLDELDNINVAEKPSAVTEYWEASKGDTIRGFFQGWKILEKKDEKAEEGVKKIPAVIIQTKDGKYLAGSMQIVDSFMAIPIGSAVYVECTHSKSSEMKKFDIRILD